MNSARHTMRVALDRWKEVGATQPGRIAELYELHPEVHQELVTWASEQAAVFMQRGLIPVEMLATQLYFTLFLGAELKKGAWIP